MKYIKTFRKSLLVKPKLSKMIEQHEDTAMDMDDENQNRTVFEMDH